MRTAWPSSVLAIVLLWAGSAPAEPATLTILVPEVMVRSGPSPEFYPTSRLRQGDKVRVVREEATGWLAIEPPPGSFSWIDSRLVELLGTNAAVVSAAEAQIWVGSRLIKTKPTVWRTKVKKGTQVTIIGRALQAPQDVWLAILPVPSEVRYIPAEATRPGAAPQIAAAPPEPMKPSSSPANFPFPGKPAAAYTTGPPSSTTNTSGLPPAASSITNRLWLQAEEAERAGNVAQAKELFQELAEQVKSSDHDLWVRCLNRIQGLQERRLNGSVAPTSGLATGNSGGAAGNRLVPFAAAPPAMPAAPASSEYCYLPDSGYTARLSPPISYAPSPPPPPGQWSGPGFLRRTAFAVDGRPVFCLQPFDANQRHIYVAPAANVNLEPYVNRSVYLYGTIVYRGDLRTNYMTVLQVHLVR